MAYGQMVFGSRATGLMLHRNLEYGLMKNGTMGIGLKVGIVLHYYLVGKNT